MEVENGPLFIHFPLQTGGAIHFHVSFRECNGLERSTAPLPDQFALEGRHLLSEKPATAKQSDRGDRAREERG